MSLIEAPDHIPDLRRVRVLYLLILVGMGGIVARLWYLQWFKSAELEQAAQSHVKLIRRVAARGEIQDAKGRTLAASRPRYVISVVPEDVKKNPQVVPLLATLLHQTEEELRDAISVNKKTPWDPVPVQIDVAPELLAQIQEQCLDLPGVLITQEPIRYYKDNRLCTHILGLARPIQEGMLTKEREEKGYRGGDYIGMMGLEASYESELRGIEGGRRIMVDARGRMQRSMDETKPLPGHTLRLSLDLDLQRLACKALHEQLNKGHPGSIVALDPRSGGVLAFASSPTYDLNRYGKDFHKLQADPLKPELNRASGSAYPCGSPFKLVTAAAGLESGQITSYTRFYCPGSYRMGNRTFKCDAAHGSLEFEDGIGRSCNTYFWNIAVNIGIERIAAMSKRFGIGSRTGLDLPGENRYTLCPTPAWAKKIGGQWYQGMLLNTAIGQGDVQVTPLQLACYTAALGNGGTLWKPHLVREVLDVSGSKPVVARRIKPEAKGKLGLSEKNRLTIVEGMERAVQPHGTAAASAIPGLHWAAKTGTSENYKNGKKQKSHSVFVCFAPAEHPKIAIAVFVENGGWGADVAAPIARRLLMQYLDIKPH